MNPIEKTELQPLLGQGDGTLRMKKFKNALESHSRGAAATHPLPKLQFQPRPCEQRPLLDPRPHVLSSEQPN